jgi:hypothetical protein
LPEPGTTPAGAFRGGESFLAAGIILAACALLCAPLWLNDALPRGSDIYATVHYLDSFMKALSDGDWLPRWSMGTNRGLGGPAFIMFPPLYFYWAAAASWGAGGIILGIKLTLTMIALATACSFYLLAREWAAPGLPAAAGAAIYLLLPYHVLDMYQRYAMPETTSFIFFPLILLFLKRILDGGGAGAVAGMALSYAGLIYTHLVSAFSFSLVLGIWLLWECRKNWKSLTRPVLILMLGLAIAAPALIPAIELTRSANVDWVRQMPNGDFRINFIFKDPILPGLTIRDPVKPLVFRSAHAQLFLAAAAFWMAWMALQRSDRSRRQTAALMMSVCALSYLMQIRISTPVWHLVPQLKTIQFPWRFQTYMVLAASMLVALALAGFRQSNPKLYAMPLAVVALLLLVNFGFGYKNAHAKPFDFTDEDIASNGVRFWVEPSLTPLKFHRFMRFRREQLDIPEMGFVTGSGSLSIESWKTSSRSLTVTSISGGEVLLRSFWFPGWRAWLDGEEMRVWPSERDGLLSFEVPPGEHQVVLKFGSTPVGKSAGWAGFLAVMVLAGTCGRLVYAGAGEIAPAG